MSLLEFVLNPVRYVLGQTMRTVFAEEVRDNPTIIHAEIQSDDVGTSIGSKRQRRASQQGGKGYRKAKEAVKGFKPQYVAALRPPRTDVEAQRLYNHIRTLAFYLDAIPFLGRRLPFNIGLDSIIGVIPIVGDYLGLLLSLYGLLLSSLFGLPVKLLAVMLLNVVLDCALGLIPIIGDAMDVAFKANLRNLRLLEDHLISQNGKCKAGSFSLLIPPSNVFVPKNNPQDQAVPVNATSPLEESPIIPDGIQKRQWTSTAAAGAPIYAKSNGELLFHNGAMSNGRLKNQSEPIVVPEYVFTTMLYDKNAISVKQMCDALLKDVVGRGRIEGWNLSENAVQLPLYDQHIDRLLNTAKVMRQEYPHQWRQSNATKRQDIRQAIKNHLEGCTSSMRFRLRVALMQTGKLQITSSELKDDDGRSKTVRIYSQSVEKKDRIFLQNKTSNRVAYDQARESVNATLGVQGVENSESACFDVLLTAQGLEGVRCLTESSIANILVMMRESDSESVQILTPDASALPLLPGIFRNELIRSGVAKEAQISVEEMQILLAKGTAKLFLCNALRGVIPCKLID